MVGGLIEEQDVRRLEKQFGQLDTHAPAAGELAGGTVEVGSLKAQTEQSLLNILFEMSHVYGIELLRERGHLLYELHVFVTLVVCAGGLLVVDAVYLCLDFVQMGKCLASLFEHRAPVFGHQMLWQIGYDAILRCRNRTTCGRSYACDNLEQSAFSCAVLAHEGYTVFLVNLKRDVLE